EDNGRLVIGMIDAASVVEPRFAQLGDRSGRAAPKQFAPSPEARRESRTNVHTHPPDRDAGCVSKVKPGVHEDLGRVEPNGTSCAVPASCDLRLGQRARDGSVRVAVERHTDMAAGNLDIARVWEQA